MKRNNYDKLAPYYDAISKIVYGNRLIKAQAELLKYLKNGDRVLIIGGGTGKILEEIENQNLVQIQITYLEASEKMIGLAQKRRFSFPVEFIHSYAEDFQSDQQWNCILTPFFFDNFPLEKCRFLVNRLDKLLKVGGRFLYIDFKPSMQNDAWWKKILLPLMYTFFKITTRIETNQLADMMPVFLEKYKPVAHWERMNGFLRVAIFCKE